MDEIKEKNVLAENLKSIMSHFGDNQVSLSKKTGISQKTIGNYLTPDFDRSPTLDKIGIIAKQYKTEAWRLLIAGASIEFLTGKEGFPSEDIDLDQELIDVNDHTRKLNYKITSSDVEFLNAYFEAKAKENLINAEIYQVAIESYELSYSQWTKAKRASYTPEKRDRFIMNLYRKQMKNPPDADEMARLRQHFGMDKK